MLEMLVLRILRMSFEASIVTGAVLFLRIAFRRLPKGYSCVLWLLVLFRLLCPVALGSSVSLMPGSSIWQEADARTAADYEGQGASGQAVVPGENGAEHQSQAAAAQQKDSGSAGTVSASTRGIVWSWWEEISDRMEGSMRYVSAIWRSGGQALSLIWLAGTLFLAVTNSLQILQWKRRMGLRQKSGRVKGAPGRRHKIVVVENGRIEEPFVYGIRNPVICLPVGMEEKERNFILCHERMHIRHRDPLLRLLWQIALTLHWFNPLVWLSVFLMRKDAEMFCDESVMKHYGAGARKEYALTILRYSMKKSGLSLPAAFGESDTESRIRHILKMKRPALAASALAACAILLTAVFFLTNPSGQGGVGEIRQEETGFTQNDEETAFALEQGGEPQEPEDADLRSHYMENPQELASIMLAGAEGILEAGPDEAAVVRLSETENGSAVLYGIVQEGSTQGVLLFSEGNCQYFDWYYTSPRMVMPDLIEGDFDGDGQEELAVILLALTGTGVSTEELILLEKRADGLWDENRYTGYMEQIGEDLIWNYEKARHCISVTETGTNRPIGEMDMAEAFENDSVFESVAYGDIVTFVPEDQELYVQLLTGVRMQGEAVVEYGSYALRARVQYDGDNFSLGDYEIISLNAI